MPPLRLITVTGTGAATAQLALAEQLLQVLDAEWHALKQSDAAALAAASAEKTRLLKAIDPHAYAQLPAAERERVDALLRRARDRNLRNGEFIIAQQAYVRARWAGLASAAGHAGFYNAAGITHLPPKPRYALGHA